MAIIETLHHLLSFEQFKWHYNEFIVIIFGCCRLKPFLFLLLYECHLCR
jgi:hypothetical protein